MGAEPPAWKTLPPDSFARVIAPRLRELQAAAIQAATGLSASNLRRVRFGHHVPHRTHERDEITPPSFEGRVNAEGG